MRQFNPGRRNDAVDPKESLQPRPGVFYQTAKRTFEWPASRLTEASPLEEGWPDDYMPSEKTLALFGRAGPGE
jgi:hypothetical protein